VAMYIFRKNNARTTRNATDTQLDHTEMLLEKLFRFSKNIVCKALRNKKAFMLFVKSPKLFKQKGILPKTA